MQSQASNPVVIVLVGMMGAGKTSVGRELSRAFGEFVDLDRFIEQSENKSIRELFESIGESGFRQIELKTLREIFEMGKYQVISTGGGVVVTKECRDLLRSSGAFVVWLTASNNELVRRATKSGNRPLLDESPSEKIQKLVNERASLYEEVANLKLNTEGMNVKQVAHLIEETVNRETANG